MVSKESTWVRNIVTSQWMCGMLLVVITCIYCNHYFYVVLVYKADSLITANGRPLVHGTLEYFIWDSLMWKSAKLRTKTMRCTNTLFVVIRFEQRINNRNNLPLSLLLCLAGWYRHRCRLTRHEFRGRLLSWSRPSIELICSEKVQDTGICCQTWDDKTANSQPQTILFLKIMGVSVECRIVSLLAQCHRNNNEFSGHCLTAGNSSYRGAPRLSCRHTVFFVFQQFIDECLNGIIQRPNGFQNSLSSLIAKVETPSRKKYLLIVEQ